MARRRQILKGLLKNASAAYYAAIEIHNKPNIEYRYETSTILMLNAWELLLKAYVRKHAKGKLFLENGNTITFEGALKYVEEAQKTKGDKEFRATAENLRLLLKYRNSVSHYYDDELAPAIFSLLAKAAINFVAFYEEQFGTKLFQDKNLCIMPLGFELPFEPKDFLSPKAPEYRSSKEVADFIDAIVSVTADLRDQGINEAIVVGYTLSFSNIKKSDNADIVAHYESSGIPLINKKTVRLSTEANAAPVYLSDDEFFEQYPLTYDELVEKCREVIPGFKLTKQFHRLKESYLQCNPQMAGNKSADRDGKNARTYYSRDAPAIIHEHWNDDE